MQRWTWLLALMGLFGGLGVTTYVQTDAQSESPDPQTALLENLRLEVARLQDELEASRARLSALDETQERSRELSERVVRMEGEIRDAREKLTRQKEHLALLESTSREAVVRAVDQEISGFAQDLGRQWAGLSGRVEEIAGLTRRYEGTLRELSRGLHRDTGRMWSDLLGPTVQLAGDSTVGSGVLLPSIEDEDGGHRTYLLTAWHVVRDIQPDPQRPVEPVPVHVYHTDGTRSYETATLLAHDAGIDAALLLMDTDRAFDFGARLAPREMLARVRIFESVYAVGCPLGNDPIPTFGEVADVRHQVDGEPYWMISAPTYIGNSGGGIFDADTHELIGLFSKIYTHGTLRPTVVPHMGLVTPLDRVYDWLISVGHGELVPEPAPTAPPAPDAPMLHYASVQSPAVPAVPAGAR